MTRRKPVDVPGVVLKFMVDHLARTSVEIKCLRPGLTGHCWVRKTAVQRGFVGSYSSVKVGQWVLPAHWAGWQELYGLVSDPDLLLDHLCSTQGCWNPWHMDLVTQAVNMQRAGSPVGKGVFRVTEGRLL